MKHRDIHDLVGGLAVAAIGAFFALYGSQYTMGTAARMGPGYFPIILGWILAVLGLLVALPAWWREGTRIEVKWLNLLSAVSSVVVFGLLLKPAGVVLASIATCLVALVPSPMPLKRRLLISVVVAALTTARFVGGLQMALSAGPAGF
jgi:hypothetical protein